MEKLSRFYLDIIKELLGLTSLAFENTAHSVLLAVSYIGRDAPLGNNFFTIFEDWEFSFGLNHVNSQYFSEDTFPDHFKKLFEICKSFINEGTPKEGKHAIKCLFLNCTKSKVIRFN